jgi:hypothetical protein
MRMSLSLLSFALLLGSCGGGSTSDPYQQAVDQANAEQAQASSLGVATPCAQSSECGVLEFASASASCYTPSFQAYSLVSASASAASAAAAQERALAMTAMSLQSGPHVCSFSGVGPPPAVCVAGSCRLSQ